MAGPCVIEPGSVLQRTADTLAELGRRLDLPVCFKASFDKANRAAL
ncbi:MAG: 3-deoxy-8-phosphooctulonate synthase, partial [Gemmatimonadales bacterium]